jgi:hypothetical protein
MASDPILTKFLCRPCQRFYSNIFGLYLFSMNETFAFKKYLSIKAAFSFIEADGFAPCPYKILHNKKTVFSK